MYVGSRLVAFTSKIASGKSLVKPRARPQAELDTTTHGQEWEMEEEEDNDVDYATTSAEDVSFSSYLSRITQLRLTSIPTSNPPLLLLCRAGINRGNDRLIH